ncbi:MAG: GNAT family N-acetyltransferase [Chloroflexota bacterium]
MLITPLDSENQASAINYLRRSPYRNALPLSNATQLRSRSDVLVAETYGEVVGVISTYRDIPIPNMTFVAKDDTVVQELLRTMFHRNPHLAKEPIYALLPVRRRNQLAHFANILEEPIEYQMVVEPETLRAHEGPPVQRLTTEHIPQIAALVEVAGLTVWDASMLELGPAFGCFVDDQLVAMAATHFATTDVAEIGHIATHPDYRRRGYASACTIALTKAAFKLTPRVFLMVLEENEAALATYKRLGFYPIERFYLTRSMLHNEL